MAETTIPELLDSFSDAAENQAYDEARRYLERIEQRYRDVDVAESVRQSQALQARDRVDIPMEKREKLDAYAQTANATNLTRAGFLATGAIFVASPESTDVATVTDAAGELRQKEKTLADHEETAGSILSDVSLPAKVDIVSATVPDGPHPKGDPVTATVVVQNVGDEPATGVELSHESNTPVSPETISLDSLGPDQRSEVEFVAQTDAVDSVSIDLQLTSEDAGKARQTVDFEVSDKGELAASASTSLEELVEYLRDASIPKGKTKSLVKKARAADSRVSKAESFIDEGRAKQANNMFTTAINQLGAFLNEIERNGNDNGKGGKGNGNQIPATVRQTAIGIAESTIDLLAVAKQAEI